MPLRRSPLLIVISLFSILAPGVPVAQSSSHGSSSSQTGPVEALRPALAQQARPAIVALRERLHRGPLSVDLLVALGEAYARIGDVRRALATYRQALDLQPNHAESFYRFWTLRRAHLVRSESDVLDPRIRADEPVQSVGQPSSLDPLADLGTSGEGGEVAASHRVGPRLPEEKDLRRGLLLAGQGRLEAAVRAYVSALARNPDSAVVRVHLAQALMLQRKWHEAQRWLEDAVRLAPDLAPAQYQLGLVRYTLDDLEGARRAYQHALEADPAFLEARFQLGMVLHVLGQENHSLAHLRLAAARGMPQAQFLVGSALARGRGSVRDRAEALRWWFAATEGGAAEARDALIRFRSLARSGPDAPGVQRAFARYRASLWEEYPDLHPREEGELLGRRLLSLGRVREAVPVLIRETEAMSGEAHRLLEALYEVGVEEVLPPHEPRLLVLFTQAAEEGRSRAMLVLGRLYHEGLGVPVDREAAARWFAGYLASDPTGLDRWAPSDADDSQPKPDLAPRRSPGSWPPGWAPARPLRVHR